MKINQELQRKIRDKEQRARLDKVLAAANLKTKTDVETLKKKENEKRAKVNEALEAQAKKERLSQRLADKKRLQEDRERKLKLDEIKQERMKSI